jgi:hypothetical protein
MTVKFVALSFSLNLWSALAIRPVLWRILSQTKAIIVLRNDNGESKLDGSRVLLGHAKQSKIAFF